MNVDDFTESCKEGHALFAEKNEAYADSVEECGLLGVAVELVAIAARLKKLAIKNPQHGRENADAIHNCIIDALNYGAIGLYMLRTENWEGR